MVIIFLTFIFNYLAYQPASYIETFEYFGN